MDRQIYYKRGGVCQSVEELLEVDRDREECKSMLGSMDNCLVVLRCLDSLLDDV